MDIEGGEVSALRGMRAGLRQHRYRNLLLELHEEAIVRMGKDPCELVDAIREAGYVCRCVSGAPRVRTLLGGAEYQLVEWSHGGHAARLQSFLLFSLQEEKRIMPVADGR
jgi:hypothetical protein